MFPSRRAERGTVFPHPFRTSSQEAINTLAAGVGKGSPYDNLHRSSRSSLSHAFFLQPRENGDVVVFPARPATLAAIRSTATLNDGTPTEGGRLKSRTPSSFQKLISHVFTCGSDSRLYDFSSSDDGAKSQRGKTPLVFRGSVQFSNRPSSRNPSVDFDGSRPLGSVDTRMNSLPYHEAIELCPQQRRLDTASSPPHMSHSSSKANEEVVWRQPSLQGKRMQSDRCMARYNSFMPSSSQDIPRSTSHRSVNALLSFQDVTPQGGPQSKDHYGLTSPTPRVSEGAMITFATTKTVDCQYKSIAQKSPPERETRSSLVPESHLGSARLLNASSTTINTLNSVGSVYSTTSGEDEPAIEGVRLVGESYLCPNDVSDHLASPSRSIASTQLEQSPFINELLMRFPVLSRLHTHSDPASSGEGAHRPNPLDFAHDSGNQFKSDVTDSQLQMNSLPNTSPVSSLAINDTPPMRLRRANSQFEEVQGSSPTSSASFSTPGTPNPVGPPLSVQRRQRRVPMEFRDGTHLTSIGVLGLQLSKEGDQDDADKSWQERLASLYERDVDGGLVSPYMLNAEQRSISSITTGSYYTTRASKTPSNASKSDDGEGVSDNLTEAIAALRKEELGHPQQADRKSPMGAPPNLPLPPIPLSESSTPGTPTRRTVPRIRTKSSTSQHTLHGRRRNVRHDSSHSNRSIATTRTVRFTAPDDLPKQPPAGPDRTGTVPQIANFSFV